MSPAEPPRRAVLAAACATGAGLLASCTLRLESPAASSQARARQDQARSEAVILQAAASRVQSLAATALTLRGHPLAQRLAVHHRDQHAVLRAWAAAAGATTAPGPAGATTARGAAATAASLALAEREGVDEGGLTGLLSLGGRERAAALSAIAHRIAAATLLTGGDTSGAHPALPADHAARLLGSVRPAQFAVLTARGRITDQAVTTRLTRASRVLDAWESALTSAAGTQAPPEQLGYELRPRPDEPAAAARLAARALTDVITASGALLTAPMAPGPMLTLVTLLGETCAAADPLGVPLTAFPALPR